MVPATTAWPNFPLAGGRKTPSYSRPPKATRPNITPETKERRQQRPPQPQQNRRQPQQHLQRQRRQKQMVVPPSPTKKSSTMAMAMAMASASAGTARRGISGGGFVASQTFSKTYNRSQPSAVRIRSRQDTAPAGGSCQAGALSSGHADEQRRFGTEQKPGNGNVSTGQDGGRGAASLPSKRKAPTAPPDTPSTRSMTRRTLGARTTPKAVDLDKLQVTKPALCCQHGGKSETPNVGRDGDGGKTKDGAPSNAPKTLPTLGEESQGPTDTRMIAGPAQTEDQAETTERGRGTAVVGESSWQVIPLRPTIPLHLQPSPSSPERLQENVRTVSPESNHDRHLRQNGSEQKFMFGDESPSTAKDGVEFASDPLVNHTIHGQDNMDDDASSLTSNDYENENYDTVSPLTETVGVPMKLPDSIHVLADLDPARTIQRMHSPPLLDRIHDDQHHWNTVGSPETSEKASKHSGRRAPLPEAPKSLREMRMALYQYSVQSHGNSLHGTTTDASEVELKLAHAQNIITQQDQTIARLQQQMALQKKTLDSTNLELESARDLAQERQIASTEFRARCVQEQKRVENLYETEMEHTKKLEGQLSKLQSEISTLKASLRMARSESARLTRQSRAAQINDSSRQHRNPQSPPSNDQEDQIASLQAEIAKLKKASQTPVPYAAVEAIRQQLRRSQAEVVKLREKEKEARLSYDRQADQLDKLSAKVKATTDTESASRAELAKAKSDLRRVSSQNDANAGKAAKEVEELKEEVDKLRKELKEKEKEHRSETNKLKESIMVHKQKLSKSNGERLQANEEHMKEAQRVQEVLSQLNREVRELQEKFNAQEERASQLESELEEARAGDSRGNRSAERRHSMLENDLKVSRANEATLQVELKLLRQRVGYKMGQGNDNENGVLRQEISRLKHKIFELESHKDILQNAREQALKNEVMILKSGMSDNVGNTVAKEQGTQTDPEIESVAKEQGVRTDPEIESSDGSTSTGRSSLQKEPTHIPSNVLRLRHELSLAKGRLLAARNATRHGDDQSNLSTLSWIPESPRQTSSEDSKNNSGGSLSVDEEMNDSSACLDGDLSTPESVPDRHGAGSLSQADEQETSDSTDASLSDASSGIMTTSQVFESDPSMGFEVAETTIRYADV